MSSLRFIVAQCASLFLVAACGGGDGDSDVSPSGGTGAAPGSGGSSPANTGGGTAVETGGNSDGPSAGGSGGTNASGGASGGASAAGNAGIGGAPGAGGVATGGATAASGGSAGSSAAMGGTAAGGAAGAGDAGGAADSAGGSGGSAGARAGGAGGGSAAGTAGAGAGGPVAFVVEPTFTGNENPAAPLAGVLRLETDVPATVRVTVTGGDEEWLLELPPAATFTKPIVGLKPETTYSVSVSVSAGDNTLTAGPLEWTSPPLPADFIPIQVALSEPAAMEPGMTLFAARDGWMMAQAPIIIVDHEGVVRWYYSDPENRVQEDLRQLENGNFFFGRDFCSLREVDILGNVVGMWHATEYPRACDVPTGSIAVATADFHHESLVLPSGNILVLSTEARTVEGFPTDEDDANAPTEGALVLGSVILEFTSEGEIVKELSLLDLLDPTRIGRDSLDTSWPAQHVGAGQRPYDWDHANAVIYDEASDSYYASLRHQDAVIKVNRTDETLTWILGTPANWRAPWSASLLTPVGDLLWPFHQHAVQLTPSGIGMYDNGNYRAAAFEAFDPNGPEFSRAVIYSVDEAAMTVSEAWSYGEPSGDDSFFSTGMGDADWQPVTGNMLLTNAELVLAAEDPLGDDTTYAQILEVTPDGTRVFELTTMGDVGSAYPVYRAERIPDIRR